MAAKWYEKKPPLVQAEQFQQTKPPYPAGVDSCDQGVFPHVPHLHVAVMGGQVITTPIGDGDWVVTSTDGSVFSLSDAEFNAQYHPAPTP